MENMEIYNNMRQVPDGAKRNIEAGRLKGFTVINPMWRIKALTETFGPCGLGWWYVITDKHIEGSGEEARAFVDIDLFYKWNGEVSMPIPGTGGASFLTKERNGLYTSDECYKMALTDAISVAAKALGCGADVYWEKDAAKYSRPAGVKEEKPAASGGLRSMPSPRDPSPEDFMKEAEKYILFDGERPFAYCDDCRAQMFDVKRKDGTVMPIKDYVATCLKFYNRPICSKCRKAQ